MSRFGKHAHAFGSQTVQWIRNTPPDLGSEPRSEQEPTTPRALNMKLDTKVSGGSIVGSSHVGGETLQGKNNQDALNVEITEGHAIIVVCDGCSQGRHSEVGSKILSRIVLNAFKAHAEGGKSPADILAAVEETAIEKLRQAAATLTPQSDTSNDPLRREHDLQEVLNNYFAATIIGAYCTPERSFIWGLGDGVYGYNLKGTPHIEVVRAENNAPTYLFYNLYKDWPADIPKRRLSVYKEFDELPESVMVGSDGVEDIIKLKGKTFPGTDEKIPTLEDLLVDDSFRESPGTIADLLGRIQALVAAPDIKTTVVNKSGGQEIQSRVVVTHTGRYLPDDTTMVVLAKLPPPPPSLPNPKYYTDHWYEQPAWGDENKPTGQVPPPGQKRTNTIGTRKRYDH